MSQCRSCKAQITWIKTPAGKNHPVDMEPVGKFWVQVEDEVTGDRHWSLEPCYQSHFASCPQASQHRRKG